MAFKRSFELGFGTETDITDINDLTNYVQGPCVADIEVVHLSYKFPEGAAKTSQGDDYEFPLRVRKLKNEKYAFCVGSIESRKNHINLILT